MSKKVMVKEVAAATGLAAEVVDKVLAAIGKAVSTRLASGEAVKLPGLAIFSTKEYGARPGRNPKTGVPVEVPAAHRIRIKPVKALMDAVAGARD